MNIKVECDFPIGTLRFATGSFQDSSGNWDNRIVNVGRLDRNIAEDKYFETSGIDISFNDSDRYFRDMMNGTGRYIAGKQVRILKTDDTVLYVGTVRGWTFDKNSFSIFISDKLGGIELKLTETIQANEYPDAVADSIGVDIPIIYGSLIDTARKGAVRCWKTSTGKYLVAGHHCKAIVNVYEDDAEVSTGWTIENNIDGKCYVSYLTGTADYININVQGSMNDSSVLIEEPIEAIMDLIDNYTDMNYNSASMTASETVMNARNYEIGYMVTNETVEEFLSDFCYTFSADFFINENNEIALSVANLFYTPIAIFNENSILKDSFSISEEPDEIKNKIKYMYDYNYIDYYYRKLPVLEQNKSIDNWGEFYDNISLKSTTDLITALDSANRLLIQKKNPKRKIIFSIPLSLGGNLQIGDIILVSHPDEISLLAEKYQVRRLQIYYSYDYINLECIKMPAVGSSFILGDKTSLASTWNDADSADREYGYLGDSTTGFFDNEVDPAKVLS
ncbi:MAG: hypothetical protein B6I31_00095 [Desulfobacteraceae bacterium 4572_19]|nr:MAG: hypothetical protein B6I31_00095 [Desulfobacteraceae bacterium 4572_19]